MNLFDNLAHMLHTEWIYVSAIAAVGLRILAGLSGKRAVAGETVIAAFDDARSDREGEVR